MTSLSPERANTLKSAFRICNVELLKGEDIAFLEKREVHLGLVRIRDFEAI